VRGGEIVVVAASGGELNSGAGEDIFDDPIVTVSLKVSIIINWLINPRTFM
jgi:hypothetical protein